MAGMVSYKCQRSWMCGEIKMSKSSLFEYVSSALVNGELPGDFSLPDNAEGEAAIKWADGALDGVTLYHTSMPEVSEDDHILMTDAIRAAAKRDFSLADDLLRILARNLRAIVVLEDLQDYIAENHSKLDPGNLFDYGMHLLFESEDREGVKFGLSLLELFETDKMPKLKKAVRTIGLSDEFTLFAIIVMHHWGDGNNEIWELAKKTHGWGRIHAIEHLDPDTEEIRRWLLTDGVHNDVMPAYSALTCWEQSGAAEVLRNGPSQEEFRGIGDIIAGLLDEGPITGISEIEDPDEIISIYLDTADTMELILDDYKVIYEIFVYYRELISDKCPIAMKCRKLLHKYHAWCLILDAVKQGECIDMAADIGIDVTPYTAME